MLNMFSLHFSAVAFVSFYHQRVSSTWTTPPPNLYLRYYTPGAKLKGIRDIRDQQILQLEVILLC
jgi:hypothetical protein